jgi:hypothetical protein
MRLSFVLPTVILFASSGAIARADYLVGVQVYDSGANGQNVNPFYQYSTNSSTSHATPDVNGVGETISFALSNGPNVFTFKPIENHPIDIVGLNLFFNTTGTSYNPAYTAGGGIPGDLSAYVVTGSSPFAIPAAGTDVQAYNTTAASVLSTSYSGATSVEVGGSRITLTEFSATTGPDGSFTLTLTPTPEPAMIGALGTGLALLAAALYRKHRTA